jgi:hypothetical protein
MVSLLLSDLLDHTRYYSKDYTFNLDRDETISFYGKFLWKSKSRSGGEEQ